MTRCVIFHLHFQFRSFELSGEKNQLIYCDSKWLFCRFYSLGHRERESFWISRRALVQEGRISKEKSLSSFPQSQIFCTFLPTILKNFVGSTCWTFSNSLQIYSDSQKHESSCLLRDRFCCISLEPLELQKIYLHVFLSVFNRNKNFY